MNPKQVASKTLSLSPQSENYESSTNVTLDFRVKFVMGDSDWHLFAHKSSDISALINV